MPSKLGLMAFGTASGLSIVSEMYSFASMTQHASQVTRDVTSDDKVRDTMLLGAAALAVTAALGIAYQRRAHARSE
jgi:hypothetical protein